MRGKKERSVVKIYTKSGDNGETSLFGGERVRKTHARLEAYGTLDELNAFLGWFRSRTEHSDLDELVGNIQSALFDLGAHLATPPDAQKAKAALPTVDEDRVQELETMIDRFETELDPLTQFVLPGGAEDAAILHVARAVCRRAERASVTVEAEEVAGLPPAGLAYLNRLSDLLFVMSRVVNRRAAVPEPLWDPQTSETS